METQKSNMFDAPYKYMVPDDVSNHGMTILTNSGSTSAPFLNQHAAGSYMPFYVWPNQANSIILQSDALHDPRMLSSESTAGDAVLAFSEIVQRTFGEKNLNSIKKCARNMQPKNIITKEWRENGSKSSTMKTYGDKVLCSEANGNKGSPDEGHYITNDFSSTKRQHCNLMLENACSTKLNQDLVTGLDASGTNAQLVKLGKDEIRKERKRQSNRESARRSRMRKEKECEELLKRKEILKDENSLLKQTLKSLSEECLEICNENDAIEEELIKMYGPESIAGLLAFKPT